MATLLRDLSSPLRQVQGQEVHVVEIGVYSGGSLGMWKHYFGPRCRIYGVDIEPACRHYEDEQTEIFIGDQDTADREDPLATYSIGHTA